MKAAQCGASIYSLTASEYLSIKIPGFSTTYFLPDKDSAHKMSSERYMELIRPNEILYEVLRESNRGTLNNEGAKHLRRIGSSFLFFGYLGGGMQTESMPLDMLVYDEVQKMTASQMEKARERVAQSRWKVLMRLSTANFPDTDIHRYFKRSDQRHFHTRCNCGPHPMDWVVLSDVWPECVGIGDGRTPGIPKGPFYMCPRCQTLITHPRRGQYVQHVPENAPHIGWHFAQTLTFPAGELLEKYETSTDLQNFHNRCLGKPYQAADKIPVTIELLRKYAWRDDIQWVIDPPTGSVRGGLMGIDHMGGFAVVRIWARTADGRYREVWVELVEGIDCFERFGQLMVQYGVDVCCIENLPNYNDARRFAREFFGKVFIVHYQELAGEMALWKDKIKPNASQKRTDPDEDMPFIVGVDQFRLMSYALGMIKAGLVQIPHPEKYPLMQHASVQPFVPDKGRARQENIALHASTHLTRVALMTQEESNDPLNPQRKRAYVQKIGYDPHFAFAYMLVVLATIRAYGTSQILDMSTPVAMPGAVEARVGRDGVASQVASVIEAVHQLTPHVDNTCGTCAFRQRAESSPGWFLCGALKEQVQPTTGACPQYTPGEPGSKNPLAEMALKPPDPFEDD